MSLSNHVGLLTLRRSDLLQAIVPRMVSGDAEIRGHTCEAIRQILTAGVDGNLPLEVGWHLVLHYLRSIELLTFHHDAWNN